MTTADWGHGALGAAALLLGFAALFALGGWTALGEPPKPFADAGGFFVSGLTLQALALAGLALIGLRPSYSRQARWVSYLDHGFAIFWRGAGALALISAGIVFFWASTRFLFALADFPPRWLGVSRSETWWIETALACVGGSFTLAIPVLLRSGHHVGIDLLSASLSPTLRARINRWGSVLLALPVGWVLLSKGTVFAARAWEQLERSQNFGVSYVFLIKTCVPLLGFLVIVAALLNARDPFAATKSEPGLQ